MLRRLGLLRVAPDVEDSARVLGRVAFLFSCEVLAVGVVFAVADVNYRRHPVDLPERLDKTFGQGGSVEARRFGVLMVSCKVVEAITDHVR